MTAKSFYKVFLYAILCLALAVNVNASRIDRINGLTGGIAVKAPAKVATTEAITLSGAQTIDGVALTADTTPRQRVLVKDQASDVDNGIYDVNSGAWTRSPDFDGARDAVDGTQVFVNEATTPLTKNYRLSATDPVAIGTDSLTFETYWFDPDEDGAYHKRTVAATDYNPSILTSDYIISVTSTGSDRAVTISTEDVNSGSTDHVRVFIVKDEGGGAGANNITVSLETGNIDGAATAVISANYGAITIYLDGTNGWLY